MGASEGQWDVEMDLIAEFNHLLDLIEKVKAVIKTIILSLIVGEWFYDFGPYSADRCKRVRLGPRHGCLCRKSNYSRCCLLCNKEWELL